MLSYIQHIPLSIIQQTVEIMDMKSSDYDLYRYVSTLAITLFFVAFVYYQLQKFKDFVSGKSAADRRQVIANNTPPSESESESESVPESGSESESGSDSETTTEPTTDSTTTDLPTQPPTNQAATDTANPEAPTTTDNYSKLHQ